MGSGNVVIRDTIDRNTGQSYELAANESITIRGRSIADVVAFSPDFNERFDQARTKVYNQTIFVSEGDTLMTKSNVPMFSIDTDTFDHGTHDLQHGMCSAPRFELAAEEDKIADYYFRDISRAELPDHGCWENLSDGLSAYDIDPDDIPSPLNLFQDVNIDPDSGRMINSPTRPDPYADVTLRAYDDSVVAISSCPDLWADHDDGIEIIIRE